MPSGFSYIEKKVVLLPACLDFCPLCSPDCTDVCREVVFQRLCICMFKWILVLGTCLPRAGGLPLELLALGQGYSMPEQGQTVCDKCRFPPSRLIGKEFLVFVIKCSGKNQCVVIPEAKSQLPAMQRSSLWSVSVLGLVSKELYRSSSDTSWYLLAPKQAFLRLKLCRVG